MSFDGFFLHHMIEELRRELVNGRIQKINQPFEQELVLQIRSNRQSHRLLLSAHPVFGRIQLTQTTFENPELAEMMSEFDAYIGELFISIDKAHEQAEEYGHSFEREMGFLAVHGFLHINGYDHYTPEEEAEMFGLQEEILTAYGLTRQ